MPTFGRLISALSLALVAYLAADQIRAVLPDSIPARLLLPVSVILALGLGWHTLGRRLGHGWTNSINAGLTAGGLLTFWALLLFSGGKVWKMSFRKVYRDPWDALNGVLDEFLDYGSLLLDVRVILVLVIGSALAGLVSEIVNRKLP